VFAAAFLPNLLAFLLGQAVAWRYLRTGRTWVGGLLTLGVWSLLDAWLLARYVFAVEPVLLRALAGSLQGLALAAAARLAFTLWRRRWSAAAKDRPERFRAAMAAYLRGEWEQARAEYRGLVRVDPWDAAAWLGLGDTLARSGDAKGARRCYGRAAGVDVGKQYADLLQLRQGVRRAG
jgi:tetratricopeptide (TPR) repeat protein